MAWFAFDIDAYDADTMHLSLAEDGAYSRLLRFYYKTRVPLPDDDRALAAIARVSVAEWDAIKETIRAFFKSRRGKLHHKRCDKELDREDSLARKRSDKAKNAAEKRHGKTRTSVPRAHTEHTPSKDTDMLGDATRPDQTRDTEEANASSAADAAASPEAPIPLDTKAAIFGEQLAWLKENTGRSEGQLRSWLGKCCGQYGEVQTLAAILNIRAGPSPVDPISRMRTILERQAANNGRPTDKKLSAVESLYAGAALALAERERSADRRTGDDAA